MTEMSIDVTLGDVRGIPVSLTSSDVTLLTGPAQIFGWSLREGSGDAAGANENSVVAPGAGATIATLTGLPAGTYDIQWEVELTGAAAAADANNFQLASSSGLALGSVNAGAAGVYQQPGTENTIGAAGTFSIKAIGAGTAGVTYSATLTITPSQQVEMIVEIQDGGQPLGEVSAKDSGIGSAWFGAPGLHVSNQIKIHVVSGVVVGVVYAGFQR